MQLTRAGILTALALSAGAGAAHAAEGTGGTLLRLFNDSQHLSVRSMIGDWRFELPRDHALAIHWNHERVLIPGIEAPAGSAEAVDAITTASRPISGDAYDDFLKVRNELQGSWSRPHLGVDYYYSTESDFLGQQLAARMDRDVHDQLNVSFGTSYGWDAISPLADDDTQAAAAHRHTLHGNVVATQILTPSSLVRFGVEFNLVKGLQHNPYRSVFAGGSIVPERHPDQRQRRDAFVKFSQYFQNRSSLRGTYRLYTDDWGIVSHELGSRLSQYVTSGIVAQYEYRWYTQTAADFASDLYASTQGIDGYLTGDYRMGALASHLFGVGLDLDFGVMAPDVPALRRLGLRLDWERYFNSNNYSANILETGLELRF